MNFQFSPDHYPVMLNEIIDAFSKYKEQSEVFYLDGTFGRGGHYQCLKQVIPQMKAIVFDQDTQAILYGQENFKTHLEKGELILNHSNFSNFEELTSEKFDMMLLDLGVSSPQLDEATRGFSFYNDGPLDMRMNPTQTYNAEYIINTASEDELIDLFKTYGEVFKPYRVVRAIVHDRKTKAFQTTRELAGLIERVDGWRQKGHHPATQYFMALRLKVNSELEVVEEALPKMIKSLKMGGRLAVISFHSLEDRIVKNTFKEMKQWGEPIHKKILVPTQEECDKNSRSRSAKLRIFERKEVQDERKKYSKY